VTRIDEIATDIFSGPGSHGLHGLHGENLIGSLPCNPWLPWPRFHSEQIGAS